MRKTLLWSALFLLTLSCSLQAETDDGTWYEGTTERDGVCINYKIFHYYTSSGRKALIMEQECGWDCWETVYNGPLNVYAGPYTDILGGTGLPIHIGMGGHGYVTVPLGKGGMLSPGPDATCNAVFTANQSTTTIIQTTFFAGIVLD